MGPNSKDIAFANAAFADAEQKSFEIHIVPFLAVVTALLLAAQEGRLASPDTCVHALKLRVNDGMAVCAICRATLNESTPYGIHLTGVHD